AARVRHSPIREPLLIALEDWARVKSITGSPGRERLERVVEQADHDPWRRQLRSALKGQDAARLAQMAEREDTFHQPPLTLLRLVGGLASLRSRAEAEAVLRRVQQQYPSDFWINHDLANLLERRKSGTGEALGFYRVALALRPQSTVVL